MVSRQGLHLMSWTEACRANLCLVNFPTGWEQPARLSGEARAVPGPLERGPCAPETSQELTPLATLTGAWGFEKCLLKQASLEGEVALFRPLVCLLEVNDVVSRPRWSRCLKEVRSSVQDQAGIWAGCPLPHL